MGLAQDDVKSLHFTTTTTGVDNKDMLDGQCGCTTIPLSFGHAKINVIFSHDENCIHTNWSA